MESELQKELQPPEEFPFPFQPYDIQKDFMRNLYMALERGCIGIFESPTGTGKSLSLICGALKWLTDFNQREKERVDAILAGKIPAAPLLSETPETKDQKLSEHNSSEPDWFATFDEQKAQKDAVYKLKEEMQQRAKREARLKKLKEEHGSARWRAKRKREDSPSAEIERLLAEGSHEPGGGCHDNTDADIILAEYFSGDESKAEHSSDSEEDTEEEHVKKIYYCSRTHSQLAQFVKEVQKSPYGDHVHVVTLGSRQNLCINEAVTRLRSLTLINDRCLEMQKNKKKEADRPRTIEGQSREKRKRLNKSAAGCPFYKPGPLENFRDLALAEVRDIEQLVTMGRELKACPYYGVRHAIPAAELVVLPYNTLLHAPTREAVGVRLKGNVVIIDEAHNLQDTISNVYSVEVTGAHVTKAHSQLSQYMERYRSRLKAKNLMYINQILHVLSCFIKTMENKMAPEAPTNGPEEADARLLRLNDFLFFASVDNVNLFKILKYCERSQISRKLNGFVDRYSETLVTATGKEPLESVLSSQKKRKQKSTSTPAHSSSSSSSISSSSTSQASEGPSHHQMNSPLMLIESFLQALTNADKDGRVVIYKRGQLFVSSLRFLLLNPSVHFSSIVQEARAVIVAGGTMQPVSEFKDQLLMSAGVSSERITEFSCGHVIPPDHLLPLCLCKGPSGVLFDFTYQNRDSTSLIDELGRALVNLCAVVPGGVVCFFPSYDYERRVHTHWSKAGVLERISKKKRVFREPKLASQVEPVLSQYARCIEFNRGSGEGVTGAVLLCVVGGKLSEGINFSDDLGRCIVMVGLPYPNIKSPELNEKIEYLNSTMPRHPDGRLPGQVHYENLCMKAVNQSIGRSIRHSRDYACIVLVDQRYERCSVRGELPEWIGAQLQICPGFGQAFAAVRKFFVAKKKKISDGTRQSTL